MTGPEPNRKHSHPLRRKPKLKPPLNISVREQKLLDAMHDITERVEEWFERDLPPDPTARLQTARAVLATVQAVADDAIATGVALRTAGATT